MKQYKNTTKNQFAIQEPYSNECTSELNEEEDFEEIEDINCLLIENNSHKKSSHFAYDKTITKSKESISKKIMPSRSFLNKKKSRSMSRSTSIDETSSEKLNETIEQSTSLMTETHSNNGKESMDNDTEELKKNQKVSFYVSEKQLKLVSNMELFMQRNFPEAYDKKTDSGYHFPRKTNLRTNHVDFAILDQKSEKESFTGKDKDINKMTIPQLPKLKWSPLPNEDYSIFLKEMQLQSSNYLFLKYTDEYILEYLMLNYYNKDKCLNEIGHCVQFILSQQQQNFKNACKFSLKKEKNKFRRLN